MNRAIATGILVIVVIAAAAGIYVAQRDDGDKQDATERSARSTTATEAATTIAYPIVKTNQKDCYDNTERIDCPAKGEPFFGEDGFYRAGAPVSYTINGDGTVTDNSTGLIWQRDPGEKGTYDEAVSGADSFKLAGHGDWRLPTIKELYSLILFTGTDPSVESGGDTSLLTPFIDTKYFDFSYGDESAGERVIDSQWTTSNVYKSTAFGGQECFFGVNFADGRIKCYPTNGPGSYYTIYVRDTGKYGENDFVDGGNGTVDDRATGLTWQRADSGKGFDWEAALAYCDGLKLGGAGDWRLPNPKQLQSIVDYSRAPDVTGSAAIDPVFKITSITNEAGEEDYPSFWTSTTHLGSADRADQAASDQAAYISFGRALGYMNGQWIDVHGAGAQRSDPKTGDASEFPTGRGPQGDAVRIANYARCVRG